MLWPSIGEMARDLDDSPSELLRRRVNGDLPDPRHDPIILARAMHQDVYMRQHHLAAIRATKERKPEITERKEKIGEFFNDAGGAVVVARKAGTSANALRVAKARARLPASLKHELVTLAREIGHDLDLDLFEPL